MLSGRATGSRMSAISSASAPRTSSGLTSLSKRDLPKLCASRAAVVTPRSAAIRISSSSSSAAASSLRLVKRPPMFSPILAEERLGPGFLHGQQAVAPVIAHPGQEYADGIAARRLCD